MDRQRGITLSGLLITAIVLAILGGVALKILPEVMDYFTIVKDVKATAQDPALRESTPADIRRAFDRRLQLEYVTGISGSDLDITRQGSEIVITFAYTKKIPLFRNVSLVIDFEGSSAK